MRAVYINDYGSSGNLEIRDVSDPDSPTANQILVKVKAAGINRADIIQRKGFYPAPKGYPERIPGLEFAGEVIETGSDCLRFAKGDRVMGITAGGAQAEMLIVEEGHAVRIPNFMDFNEAAAIPEAFVTAHDAVWTQGRLEKGEVLLIHAVGSGVGLAALQIAKAFGHKVIGTSRTSSKIKRIEGLDLSLCIDGAEDERSFSKQVQGFGGADVILDLVGGAYLDDNLRSLNPRGRLIAVGLVGGRNADINLGLVLSKRIKLIGTVLRSRSLEEKVAAVSAFESSVLPLVENGMIKANLDRVFSAEEVALAHDYVESNESFGKVVLDFAQE